MAYVNHAYVSIGGGLADGPYGERWNIGVRVAQFPGTTPTWLADPQGYLTYITPRVQSWWSTVGNRMASVATLDTVKANNIDPDGTYHNKGKTYQSVFAGVAGPASAQVPGILSLCFSWKGDQILRGPGSNGRVYPPNFSFQTSVAGSMAVSDANALLVAQAGAALLKALSTTDASYVRPILASASGPWQGITSIRGGNIYDVQRRRKNKQRETYQTVPYSAT